ncbi:MAG: Intein-containing protein [Parcubacteria group bacterium GW2011_GWA2_45_15]|nr:MAG: Intein-containing protein [Parcubacteria group bacterium GW2011_GWA2_45_15]
MAYVVGFFAADGYMTVNKRGGQYWSIDIGDKTLLNKIKTITQSEHTISVRKRGGGKYTTYRLQVGSIEMCNDLRKLGYNERKTNSLSVPNVPKKYFPDFVRGYFDGDGNVWSGFMYKSGETHTLAIQTVFTSCSEKFLEKIRVRLETFDIKRGVLKQGKGNYYRLTYSVLSSLKLYDFMYNGRDTSSLFLKRKKDVFEKYEKMRL